MKNLLLSFSTIILLFSSCREVEPAIDFSKPVVPLKDSTYIASPIPAAQHKIVLIEDVTGVRCGNCPDAAKKAKDILTQKTSDSVIVIALYPLIASIPFTTPYDGFPLLASETNKQIVEALGVPGGLPTGYIDRKHFTGKGARDISYPEWINSVNERLKEKTPVNIYLNKTLNNRNLKVEIKLEYNTAAGSANSHKYAIYLLEDNIVSKQENHLVEDPNYIHNHVLRYAFGLPIGNPLKGTYEAGRTFVKQFEYEIPAEYVIANCHLVCMVMDGTTQEVINVREIDL